MTSTRKSGWTLPKRSSIAFNDFVKEVVLYPIGEILPKREEIRQTAMKKLGRLKYHHYC